jgi:hypothetical protein
MSTCSDVKVHEHIPLTIAPMVNCRFPLTTKQPAKLFFFIFTSSWNITDGRWARNNSEKANTFAQHLEKRFHPNPGLGTLLVLNSIIWTRFHWSLLEK